MGRSFSSHPITTLVRVSRNDSLQKILAEVARASSLELSSYLAGASRDGTSNRGRRTFRFHQKEVEWLNVLQAILERLGSASWIYREGSRHVWVVETRHPVRRFPLPGRSNQTAFVRGYFDAEGGTPHSISDRFYVQLVQKDRRDLEFVRSCVQVAGVDCGAIHNPSARVDPNYWRFYVAARSHRTFAEAITSWHPRKRAILDDRYGETVTARLPNRSP